MSLNTPDCIILDAEEDEDGDAVVQVNKAQRLEKSEEPLSGLSSQWCGFTKGPFATAIRIA